MPRKIKIDYINESGKKCDAVVTDAVHHSYYSSKRDYTGRYPKKDITYLHLFMSKLEDCKIIKIEQLEN